MVSTTLLSIYVHFFERNDKGLKTMQMAPSWSMYT